MPERLVLYDGDCGVCTGLVQFLLDRDSAGVLHYAPLQGETASALRVRHAQIPEDLDTMVLVEGDDVHLRSRAAFRVARLLPWPWKALGGLRYLPVVFTDATYRVFAALRYRLGRQPTRCRLATPEEAGRFLP